MSERARHVTSNDGRHRVAYEMALGMWEESTSGIRPKLDDQEEFLKLVKACTSALAYRDG